MLPKFLWRHQWARRAHGDKWERQGLRWLPVKDWSTPKTHPDLYAGGPPEREEWT